MTTKKSRPKSRTANRELVFNRWLVNGSPATSTIALPPLGTSLGSVGTTTGRFVEVFCDGVSIGDVGMTEAWSGLVEGVVGTDGEMLVDDLVPVDKGCFVVCATVVVLVVVGEVIVVGLVGIVDDMAGVEMVIFGTATVVAGLGVVGVGAVVKLFCKTAGVGVIVEFETLV